jgi:prolyl-tRNA synthetase
MAKEITSRSADYAQWYNDLVLRAGLADYSAVRGCMVIKPYGFGIWERMRDILDAEFKRTGHQNAAFPLFIPKSFLAREAKHVEGFAKECAVVTHYRLKTGPDGDLIVDPEARLEEELIVRPTSETIIWNTYKDWIQSYRDLPILVNQWANVVRWEMRTRLFLRTTEFFWQEGHTAHATSKEALEETLMILDVYANFMETVMAVPVLKGVKTANERFAGAVDTYTCEAMMQDAKALQMGTSHFLGQNFAKAFDVKFLSEQGQQEYVWATSWGVSTRLMGALVMCHSDDDGLILPPKLATIQVVIVPVYKKAEELATIGEAVGKIKASLEAQGIRVKYDGDDHQRPGWKFAEYELKGVPVRIVVGPRDLQSGSAEVARRDTKAKTTVPLDALTRHVSSLLSDIQQNLYNRALQFRESNTSTLDDFDTFQRTLDTTGGFIWAHWDGTSESELAIKEKTKATIRLIPLDGPGEEGKCIYSGRASKRRVLFARAY